MAFPLIHFFEEQEEEEDGLNIPESLYFDVSLLLSSNRYNDVTVDAPYEYVDVALDILKGDPIRSLELLKHPMSYGKGDTASERIRRVGNKLYKKQDWIEALKTYNRSIACATDGSTELGFAYANRSALLFERGFYKECLEDIDRVLKMKYPEDKKAKVIERQSKAKDLLPNQEKKQFHPAVPTISRPNSNIRSAADCIKINENETFGRFVEATRDIRPSEILVVEKPYVINLLQNYQELYCGHCGEICFNMIPCINCSCELYCSEACREKAFEEYHEYECVIKRYFPTFFMDAPLGWLALRTTLKGLKEFNSSPENTGKYESNRYKEISELQSHIDKLSKKIIIELSYNVAKCFLVLKRDTDILTRYNITENELKYFLIRDKLMTSVNEIPLMCFTPNKEHVAEAYGAALYCFGSLFNHSCVQNVEYYSYGSTIVMKAYKKIKAGEQCFVDYGLNYLKMPKSKRQRTLRMRHLFTCKCPACEGDWPMSDQGCLDQDDPFNTLTCNAFASLLICKLMKRLFDKNGNAKQISENKRKKLLTKCHKIADCIRQEEPSLNHVMLYDIFERIMQYGNKEIAF